MEYFGFHLMLDCSGCKDIDNRENIYNFNQALLIEINMTPYGEPIIEFMLPGDPKQGYTLLQLITTSNICAHFLDKNRTAYIDIFSCKEFNIDKAKLVVEHYFQPDKIRVNFITRNAS